MRLACSLGLGLLVCSTAAIPQAPLPGRVVDIVTGRGIPGVKIRMTETVIGPGLNLETTSGPDGEFLFSGGITSLQKTGYRQMRTGGPNDLGACCQWEAGLQDHFESPDPFSMMPYGELSGVLLRSGGQKAAGASVSFQHVGSNRDDTQQASFETPVVAVTDQNGRFHARLDAVDTDVFVADETCGALSIGRVRLKPDEQRTAQFTIPKRSLHTVRGTISNQVPPLGNGEIHLQLDPISRYGAGCYSQPHIVLPESGGAFSIKGIPPGKYTIEAGLQRICFSDVCSLPAWNAYHSIEVVGRDIAGISVTLFPNAQVTATMHWEGRVPLGYDIPEVYLVDQTGIWYHSQGFAVDKAGEDYVFPQVQPGQHALKLRSRTTDFYLREVRLNGSVTPADSISVGRQTGLPGEDKAHLDLYLSANVSQLQALGVDQNHRSLKRHVVLLFQLPEGPYTVLSPWGVGVPPGDYFVLAFGSELPYFAFQPEYISRYTDQATRVSLKPGKVKLEVVALEAHPLAR
jgi:hypothetical protein